MLIFAKAIKNSKSDFDSFILARANYWIGYKVTSAVKMLVVSLKSYFAPRGLSSAHQPLIRPMGSAPGWKCCPKALVCIVIVATFILFQNIIFSPFTTNVYAPKVSPLKFILMWTPSDFHPFNLWKSGQDVFFEYKCPVYNCYVTKDRDFFGGDLTKFDAIVFNGRNLQYWNPYDLPKKRSPHQKYIFLNMESSDNKPVCNPIYDAFFNWTATYKLNSDIVFSYFLIHNSAGEVVGPQINMTWIEPMEEINDTFVRSLKNKTKAAAWFVSHCTTRSRREEYADSLKAALKKYNLTLDIFGECGNLKCPRNTSQSMCEEMLKEKYFFYLSFENSFAEDYVTEKVLTALDNHVVPIVYSGANYSRFLPHGSYLDARSHKPEKLAKLMASIIASPAVYYDFFRWRNHYTYHYHDGTCRLCAALNNKEKLERPSVYENFRSWWNPHHHRRCSEEDSGLSCSDHYYGFGRGSPSRPAPRRHRPPPSAARSPRPAAGAGRDQTRILIPASGAEMKSDEEGSKTRFDPSKQGSKCFFSNRRSENAI